MDFCYRFEKMVKNYIEEHKMISPREHVIIGVSGGADSLCLLDVLHRFSVKKEWRITAVHINHGIRGGEAEKDQQFVEEFCRRRGIACVSRRCDVPLEAALSGEGEEEAARRLRYEIFDQEMRRLGADKIALAHHRGDQAETVLFHFIRGSGLNGLCGMRPVWGKKIRPFLDTRKEDICQYLKERGISYRTDQSNFSEKYQRNYLRLKVFPLLERVNTGTVLHISRTAAQLSEAEIYLREQTDAALFRLGICGKDGFREGAFYIEKEAYEREHVLIQKRAVYEAVSYLAGSKKDLEEHHILSIHKLFFGPPGKRAELPYHLQARRDITGVWLEKRVQAADSMNINTNRNTKIGAVMEEMALFSEEEQSRFQESIKKPFFPFLLSGEKKLPGQAGRIRWKLFFYEKNALIPKNGYTKWFDYDKIATTALFRTRRAGDWFVLDASGRHKKLKQYFIDEKVPKEQRGEILLFAEGNHIIWIAGGRISEEYKVRETTHVVLELALETTKGMPQ